MARFIVLSLPVCGVLLALFAIRSWWEQSASDAAVANLPVSGQMCIKHNHDSVPSFALPINLDFITKPQYFWSGWDRRVFKSVTSLIQSEPDKYATASQTRYLLQIGPWESSLRSIGLTTLSVSLCVDKVNSGKCRSRNYYARRGASIPKITQAIMLDVIEDAAPAPKCTFKWKRS